ncbi:hypothetical protein NBH00_05270 [Paraconexibacter antarcticus]|uniref:Uncharacterized protein n=1 Tax=Paraconexibacter antarcticus TaxID=2949664 RepID=A0ABY5DVD1_9ACTN|nr:hypothetical protein [Paraconexibacter antarcticus]UTI65621.1 hypothetical protein NBH00_05270 [Paraconexibacter antarcticus]
MSQEQAGFLRDTAPAGASLGALLVAGTEDLRFAGGKSSFAAVLSTAGDNAVIAPAAGKRIRVYWVAFIPSSDNASANLVTVGWPSTAVNMYIGYALAHWEVFTGAINEPVNVNLANAQPVAVTIHYQEIA